MVLCSFDGYFCGVDAMIVWLDELYCCFLIRDEGFYGFGALVVHHVEARICTSLLQRSVHVLKYLDHTCVGSVFHWSDNNIVLVINISNKNVLHTCVGL